MTAHLGSVEVRRLRIVGLALAWFTIAWNVVEAVVAIAAGAAASSTALVAFGIDATIEVASAAVVVWQFSGELRGGYDEDRKRLALRLIAVTFFLLAAYVAFEALRDLFGSGEAEQPTVGVVLAIASVIVMPALAVAKRRTADQLGSPTLRADSRETLLCSWLSLALLGGLVVNSWLGWWWADPIAALVIGGFAVSEGIEAWRGHDD